MPNKFVHTIYKIYVDMETDEKNKKAMEAEQMMDEMEDAMT